MDLRQWLVQELITSFRIDCLGVAPQTYIFLERGESELSIGVIQTGERADPSLAHRWFITHIPIYSRDTSIYMLIYTSTFIDMRLIWRGYL